METAIDTLIKAIEARAEQFGWACSTVTGPDLWLEVGPHKLLLFTLPEDSVSAEKFVDKGKEIAFNQWLIAGEAGVANITMFCIAPVVSINDADWKNFASKVERDDMVCRKLVWIPREDFNDVYVFLDRTFLARPWDMAVQRGPYELSALAESLTVPTAWMERLMDSELDGAELINALLEIDS